MGSDGGGGGGTTGVVLAVVAISSVLQLQNSIRFINSRRYGLTLVLG